MSLKDLVGEQQAERILEDFQSFGSKINELGLISDLKPWSDFFSNFKPPKSWTRFI